MPHLFISYSRKDTAFAHQLTQSLTDLGADVWIDVKDISAGTKWSRAIQQGLDTCDALLVVVSPDSMASTNVEDEWQYYLEQKKPVIPVLVRPAKMHFQLSRIQYVDFFKQPYESGLRQLYTELRQHGIKLKPPPALAASARQIPPSGAGRRGRAGLIVAAVALLALLTAGGALLFAANNGSAEPTASHTPEVSNPAMEIVQPPSATLTRTVTPTPTKAAPTATESVATETAVVTEEAAAEAIASPSPAVATLEPHPIICEGAPPSRLNVGIEGRVSRAEVGELSRNQNVRPAPGTDSEPRVPIPEGTAFDIIGGPECADGYIWWEIETTDAPPVTGWTAEGEITPSGDFDYWLEVMN